MPAEVLELPCLAKLISAKLTLNIETQDTDCRVSLARMKAAEFKDASGDLRLPPSLIEKCTVCASPGSAKPDLCLFLSQLGFHYLVNSNTHFADFCLIECTNVLSLCVYALLHSMKHPSNSSITFRRESKANCYSTALYVFMRLLYPFI